MASGGKPDGFPQVLADGGSSQCPSESIRLRSRCLHSAPSSLTPSSSLQTLLTSPFKGTSTLRQYWWASYSKWYDYYFIVSWMDAKLYEVGLLFRRPTHLKNTTINLWGKEKTWTYPNAWDRGCSFLSSPSFPSGPSPWGDSIFSFRIGPVQTLSILQKINFTAQNYLHEAKWEAWALDLQCAQAPRLGE